MIDKKKAASESSRKMFPQADYTNISEIERQFSEFILGQYGVAISPVADGDLKRFPLPDDKGGKRTGWYVLHAIGFVVGICGDWRSDVIHKWKYKADRPLSELERKRQKKLMAKAVAEQKQRAEKLQKDAASRALSILQSASPATRQNPYAKRKNITPWYALQRGDDLVIPLRDVTGKLWNVQTIKPNGKKRFLKGGRKKGCFSLIGKAIPETDTIIICEGYATACTIAEQLQRPVIAAMDAGNLLPVASELRRTYPRAPIHIYGDNDHYTAGNPGITKAKAAAQAVGGTRHWPMKLPCDTGCKCTDYNDVANCQGARP